MKNITEQTLTEAAHLYAQAFANYWTENNDGAGDDECFDISTEYGIEAVAHYNFSEEDLWEVGDLASDLIWEVYVK